VQDHRPAPRAGHQEAGHGPGDLLGPLGVLWAAQAPDSFSRAIPERDPVEEGQGQDVSQAVPRDEDRRVVTRLDEAVLHEPTEPVRSTRGAGGKPREADAVHLRQDPRLVGQARRAPAVLRQHDSPQAPEAHRVDRETQHGDLAAVRVGASPLPAARRRSAEQRDGRPGRRGPHVAVAGREALDEPRQPVRQSRP
jgi:hypothetical protein